MEWCISESQCFCLFQTEQLHQVMGEDKFCAGLRFIFDGLQYPKLNKQVSLPDPLPKQVSLQCPPTRFKTLPLFNRSQPVCTPKPPRTLSLSTSSNPLFQLYFSICPKHHSRIIIWLSLVLMYFTSLWNNLPHYIQTASNIGIQYDPGCQGQLPS